MEKRHNASVRIANPLSFIRYDQNLFGSIDPQSIAALFSVAVGLATRKVEVE